MFNIDDWIASELPVRPLVKVESDELCYCVGCHCGRSRSCGAKYQRVDLRNTASAFTSNVLTVCNLMLSRVLVVVVVEYNKTQQSHLYVHHVMSDTILSLKANIGSRSPLN